MIDLNTETVVSLTEAAGVLPARRGGKRPHISCLYRWTTSGCRGIVLESVQIGGTRCTSKEALVRFFDRLTRNSAGDRPAVRSPSARQRAAERAIEELEREGA